MKNIPNSTNKKITSLKLNNPKNQDDVTAQNYLKVVKEKMVLCLMC